MSHKRVALVIALLAAQCLTARASVRDERRVGLIATYNANTQLVGPALAANPTNWLKMEAGYVVSSSAAKKFSSTLQSTAKFLVGDWDTSPYAGLGSGPDHGQLAIVIGIDHTTPGGINIGAGYSKVSSAGSSGFTLYGGYFF